MSDKLKVYESRFSYPDNICIDIEKMKLSRSMTLDEIVNYIKNSDDKNKVILVYPKDVPSRGIPIDPDVSREMFDSKPNVYGVAIYKNWNNMVIFY